MSFYNKKYGETMEPKIDYGMLEEIRRDEGYKNPDDLYDLTSTQDAMEEIRKTSSHIEIDVAPEISDNTKLLVDAAQNFALETTEEFKERFALILQDYAQSNPKIINDKILKHIMAKDFDTPTFYIATGEEAKDKLNECDYNLEISRDAVLILFQLPKPLATFWWKDSRLNDRDDGHVDGKGFIEWGKMYREVMTSVWEKWNEMCGKGFCMDRINPAGEHDPKKYYYLWELTGSEHKEVDYSSKENEQRETQFASLVDRYLEEFSKIDIDENSAEATRLIDLFQTDLNSSGLPSDKAKTIFWETKKKFLHLPESLNVSHEAMRRIENNFSQYKLEVFNDPFEDLMVSLPLWAQKALDSYSCGHAMICRDKNDEIIGITLFTAYGDDEYDVENSFVYVQYQRALNEAPGAGLMMLDQVIEGYESNPNFSKVTLQTAKIPRGLGNLGFKISDYQENNNFRAMVNYDRPILRSTHPIK